MNSIVHLTSSNNAVLHQEWYSYDAASNLQTKIVNSASTSYTYDEIDQLKSEIAAGGGVHNLYAYDANGNRTSKQSAIGGIDTYIYDDADKLLSRGSTTYSYDNCGRTTQILGPGGVRNFTWDYEDRLTNLSGSSPNTNYGYNGVGSRTSKSNANGTRTYKRNGIGVTAPVLSDGVSTMVPGIAESSGGQTNTIHTDRLGSMKAISSGSITDTAEYDAFGIVVSRTGTTNTQKGFASGFGYQEDGESGYKLLGHRYYDAEAGRFLSRDPAMDGRNWYGYVDNNPLKAVDSEGFKKQFVIMVGDIDGVEEGALALITNLKDYYESLGYTVKIKLVHNEDEMADAVADADAAAMVGHGYDFVPATSKHQKSINNWLFVKKAMKKRAQKGRGKLDFLLVYSCRCLKEQDARQAFLFLAKYIGGYSGACSAGDLAEDNFADGMEFYGDSDANRRVAQVKKRQLGMPWRLPVITPLNRSRN